MKIGPYRIDAIVDGTFALDGGAMFGIVPRPLWERTNPADDANRIALASRCLLLRGNERCILVDTGLGSKFDDRRSEIFKVSRPGSGLLGELERRGLQPDDVTDVVLTHLHFDHCGGTTWRRDGELHLTFPVATHHVQRRNWAWAHQPSDKDSGSFRREDFAPLDGSGRLRLVDGDTELFEGIRTTVVEGHSPGMQLVWVEDDETTLLFLADLVPTRTHLRWPYIMAYDNQPLVTLAEKRQILPRAAEQSWILVFQHDPECEAAAVALEEDTIRILREVELSGDRR